jgi:glycosyltransferase involved in cell wall biosynthesis
MHPAQKNIMVVGQVPPPWHGQALAIKGLIETKFDGIELQFVRMAFSRDIDDIGRFRWEKAFRLPLLIFRIWRIRFGTHCNILYYPPGGTSVPAVVRDIAVLLSCRILFKRVVFHSHAGGFVEVAEATPLPIRLLARVAYSKPDLLIQLTAKSPPDGVLTNAKRVVYVPYGLPDDGARYVARFRDSVTSGTIRLLFVGAVSLGKGVMVLLEACAQLKANGLDFVLRVVGGFSSPEFELQCKSFINDQGLSGHIEFVGVMTGNDKWEIYCSSDIFCFPSFYKAENQPLVILEAMQFGLPIVATDWRSISTMVADGETGYILPINDSAALAERIGFLIQHPELRVKMGRRAREVFLERYTDIVWRPAMQSALREV